jgi:hypothetical protein
MVQGYTQDGNGSIELTVVAVTAYMPTPQILHLKITSTIPSTSVLSTWYYYSVRSTA